MTLIARATPADGIQCDTYTGVTGEIVVDDICVYEQISVPWDLLVTPKDRKPFGHRKTYLITPSVILYQESFDACIRVQGLTPAGMLGFSLPLRLGARSTYWNAAPREAGMTASLPGAFDAVLDAGQAHVIVLVNRALVHEHWSADCVSSLECALAGRWLPARPGAVDRLAAWLLGVLNIAQQRPGMFRTPTFVRAFEAALLDRLAQTVQLRPVEAVRPDATQRQRGLARAIEFLRENDTALLTVPLLCRAAIVSQRTLEYAFRDAFGLTPMGYLRLRRLHLARRALARARPGDASVADIAYEAGFFELGRFAGEYRRLFGELPSATLRQPFPVAQGFPRVTP